MAAGKPLSRQERNFIQGLVLALFERFGRSKGTSLLMHASLLAAMAIRMEGVSEFRRKEGSNRRKKSEEA